MKVVKFLAVLLLCGIFLCGIFVFLLVGVTEKNDSGLYETKKVVTIVYEGWSVQHIVLREDAKPWIWQWVQKVSSWMYLEATVHNPKGDMLPDSIDDHVKEYLKAKGL